MVGSNCCYLALEETRIFSPHLQLFHCTRILLQHVLLHTLHRAFSVLAFFSLVLFPHLSLAVYRAVLVMLHGPIAGATPEAMQGAHGRDRYYGCIV